VLTNKYYKPGIPGDAHQPQTNYHIPKPPAGEYASHRSGIGLGEWQQGIIEIDNL
jgi:hypothetical protein